MRCMVLFIYYLLSFEHLRFSVVYNKANTVRIDHVKAEKEEGPKQYYNLKSAVWNR
jgi:hypothetical protein